ncbi:DUF2939 domain-containing protein [Pseudoduganella lutea]|uniref:DUF2939 domain-containing protein n=1 Tax=Pseudoduganella lutea TaxID=321985 RepID=A0A4P6KWJ4_9BURK|nr:DUF2939 domain-containing protein [Pseudoduganella lutea]QBE62568.1 DUF2939 domain-containing protein [Pseudoduganella lutea]
MSRRRLLVTSLFLLLSALAAFWYFSPYLTLHAMRNAAQAHDAAALAKHVDFPRVRESLKGQVRAMTERRAREAAGDSGLADVGAAFGAMLGNLVGGGLVDVMVTPERLADAMRTGEMNDAGDGEPDTRHEKKREGKHEERPEEKRWTSERRGMNVFVARALAPDGQPGIAFVLEREGFATWKLVGVELPRLR